MWVLCCANIASKNQIQGGMNVWFFRHQCVPFQWWLLFLEIWNSLVFFFFWWSVTVSLINLSHVSHKICQREPQSPLKLNLLEILISLCGLFGFEVYFVVIFCSACRLLTRAFSTHFRIGNKMLRLFYIPLQMPCECHLVIVFNYISRIVMFLLIISFFSFLG